MRKMREEGEEVYAMLAHAERDEMHDVSPSETGM